MPALRPVPIRILASRIIADAHPDLLPGLLPPGVAPFVGRHASLALFTADCDDVGYIAVDEATKQAKVEVLYASSFYAGAANASMPYAGEFIGVLAGPTPSDAAAGLAAAIGCYEHEAAFHYADEAESVIFLDHTVAACGTYFSREAGIPVGSPLAYLIAPPLEATLGLDAALKAADVALVKHFPPPTPTNFSGAWLSGSLGDCRAACAAFREAVLQVAAQPRTDI